MSRRLSYTPLSFASPYRGGLVSSANGRRLWGCAQCGRVDVWGPGWVSYGSWGDEEGGTLATACCEECMGALAKANGWGDPRTGWQRQG